MKFETSEYELSHGKAPRGFGCWWFNIGGRAVVAPAMNFTDAKKFARQMAKDLGETTIKVMP